MINSLAGWQADPPAGLANQQRANGRKDERASERAVETDRSTGARCRRDPRLGFRRIAWSIFRVEFDDEKDITTITKQAQYLQWQQKKLKRRASQSINEDQSIHRLINHRITENSHSRLYSRGPL